MTDSPGRRPRTADRHKGKLRGARLPPELDGWLADYAGQTGQTVDSVLTAAVAAFREVVTTPAAVPADRVTTTPRETRAQPAARPIGYSKERQAGNKRRSGGR